MPQVCYSRGMTHPDVLRRDLAEVEDAINSPSTMAACPYFLRGGQCETGCWLEPRCITEEPTGGWGSDLYQTAEWARDLAYEARGHHKLVKRARDLVRRAEKGL